MKIEYFILIVPLDYWKSLQTKCNRFEARVIFEKIGFNNPDDEEYFKEYGNFDDILKDLEKLFKKIFKDDVSMIIKEGIV